MAAAVSDSTWAISPPLSSVPPCAITSPTASSAALPAASEPMPAAASLLPLSPSHPAAPTASGFPPSPFSTFWCFSAPPQPSPLPSPSSSPSALLFLFVPRACSTPSPPSATPVVASISTMPPFIDTFTCSAPMHSNLLPSWPAMPANPAGSATAAASSPGLPPIPSTFITAASVVAAAAAAVMASVDLTPSAAPTAPEPSTSAAAAPSSLAVDASLPPASCPSSHAMFPATSTDLPDPLSSFIPPTRLLRFDSTPPSSLLVPFPSPNRPFPPPPSPYPTPAPDLPGTPATPLARNLLLCPPKGTHPCAPAHSPPPSFQFTSCAW